LSVTAATAIHQLNCIRPTTHGFPSDVLYYIQLHRLLSE